MRTIIPKSWICAVVIFTSLMIFSANINGQTLKFDELTLSEGSDRYFFDDDTSFDERLKRFVAQLQKERVGTSVYIIFYRPRVSTSTYSYAEQRAQRAKWEITYKTRIKEEKVAVIDGGLRDRGTVEFWIGRKGSSAPAATPSYTLSQAVNCSSIRVDPQGYQFNDLEPAVFSVELSPKKESRFEWAVSAGKIVSGEGTSEISVDVRGLKSVAVSVRALDLPIECVRERTIDAKIGLRPILIDEYGRIPSSDIRSRLDAFLYALSNNPPALGYMVIYGQRSEPRTVAAIERLLKNHFTFRNFDVSRIKIVRGGFREDVLTEIWLVPPGADPPTPRSSVDPQFVLPKPKGRRPARTTD